MDNKLLYNRIVSLEITLMAFIVSLVGIYTALFTSVVGGSIILLLGSSVWLYESWHYENRVKEYVGRKQKNFKKVKVEI